MIRESIFFANDRMTFEEIKEELLKLGVIYTGGVHAFKITKREGNNPLVTLVCEDDGHFFINENAPTFDSSWLNDLIKLCQKTLIATIKGAKYDIRKVKLLDGEIHSFMVRGFNPCGCGSNIFHKEFNGVTVYGVCNACGKDIYEYDDKEEFEEWKWKDK